MVFTRYRPDLRSIEFSIVGESNWFERRFAPVVAAYVFNVCQCDTVTAWTPIDNHRAIRMASLCGAAAYPIVELNQAFLVLTQTAWRNSKVGRRYGH